MIKLASYDRPGRPRRTQLNNVEIEVIRLLANGKKPVEIAKQKRCSDAAVCNWLINARRTVQARTNFELIGYAFRNGLIK